MTEPRHISLMDTTLRDGEQTQGVSFSPEEKVSIARALLQALKVDRIEVASARVSHGEKEAVTRILKWAEEQGFHDQVEVLGFTDHQRSVDWIVESGGRVMNLLTKGSEKHGREQLGKTLSEHLTDIEQTIAYAKERQQHGKPIAQHQLVQQHIARIDLARQTGTSVVDEVERSTSEI